MCVNTMLQTRCKASNIHIAPVEKCCLLIPEIKNTNYWICLSLSRTPNHDSFDTENMYFFVFFLIFICSYTFMGNMREEVLGSKF